MAQDIAKANASNDLPDYLKGNESSGLEGLGSDDYKTPRIQLLQALSPQIRSFPKEAVPGNFWHTGVSKSLGDNFNFTPIIARKRVIVWRPQHDQDGGILAFSLDGKNWQTGGNSSFEIKLYKDQKKTTTWKTGKNVQDSGLLNWGTYDPDNHDSQPAASLSYEYLCYLTNPENAGISPVVFSCNKTALPKAKAFNTALLMMAQSRKPLTCLSVNCFVTEQTADSNHWFVPNFKLQGTVAKEVYDITSKLAVQYSDYQVEMEKEVIAEGSKDELPF